MINIVFGDSYVGPFKLLDDNNLKVYKFKGATMKGIGKKNNKNAITINNTVKKNKNKINCLMFNFGQVDLHFSFYYVKFHKKETFNMEEIVKNYLEFIKKIKCKNSAKIVLGIFPTTIQDQDVFDCLRIYGILSKEDIKSISKSDIEKYSNYLFRMKMYNDFNKLIKKYCKLNNLRFINFEDKLLDKNNRLKYKFKNQISKYNIHLLWEPLIPILLSKLKKCKIKKKYKYSLHKTYKKYLSNKKKSIKKKISSKK